MKTIEVVINGKSYQVLIKRKISNKNMYLRVKDKDILYITCNSLISDNEIRRFILSNEKSVINMLNKKVKQQEKEENFYYLGKKYDLVYLNSKQITFGNNKVFVPENFILDKWYRKEAEEIFLEELSKMYNRFKYTIPKPSLTVRKMKTRWGVCNVKTHRITLNLELIKYNYDAIDYVIVHELSHLLHANHSKEFWQCVEDNFPNYKKVRKDLKNNE